MGVNSTFPMVILLVLLLFNPTYAFTKVGIISDSWRSNSPSPSSSRKTPLISSSRRITSKSTSTLSIENENGADPKYPWSFTGRLWFRPSLVRIPSSSPSSTTDENNPPPPSPPQSVSIINLFGWTLGGTVALEYDQSPVGPYREYVTMGALVTKRGSLGQWGSRLYVSTKEAADVCRDTWNVPAQLADIDFLAAEEDTISLSVETPPDSMIEENVQKIVVRGWENTKVLDRDEKGNRLGGLPVFWTPSIKALWAPFIPLPPYGNRGYVNGADKDNDLPLHRLRLSASAIRLTLCAQSPSDKLGIPIGIGLVVDDVLIEIARQDGIL